MIDESAPFLSARLQICIDEDEGIWNILYNLPT
jgi:hypothetical protein